MSEDSKQKQAADKKEELLERSGPVFDPPAYIQRYTTVRDILYKLPGIQKVVDFGCSEGKFIKYLKKLPFLIELSCVDIDLPSVERSGCLSRPMAWDFVFRRHESLTIKLFKGSVLETDHRLRGYSAVTCVELIEHLQPEDVEHLVSNIFGFICPKVAIFTTPNCEFNVLFSNLNGFRHWDHKFEWNREEFRNWCDGVLEKYPDYTVQIQGIGEPPEESSHVGSLTQVAIFNRRHDAPKIEPIVGEDTYTLVEEHFYPARKDEQLSEDPT